ncbi:hypothetical protein ACH4HG_33645 [Streptomyces coeruleorubidus]|uniref:Uncharacterized protein n=1 Tax=Streptomyces coeruleorubidus TaxID=116188 RepID=A0ABZ0KPV5_STRC4|nr:MULTISPECIES: hypothetical protein [Streptomyces]WOT39818.1 hypothetical protein R5U08_39430 [Streptomyces coeruleorubidus]GGU31616.1 hypothetical protein GCM10010244_67430 [Streptomyces bellus]
MTDHRLEGPGENGEPVPRDMPDQQADAGEDPWEVAPRFTGTGKDGKDDGDEADEPAGDVPDTDEAGTGRQGVPRSGTVHPEHPDPDESSA